MSREPFPVREVLAFGNDQRKKLLALGISSFVSQEPLEENRLIYKSLKKTIRHTWKIISHTIKRTQVRKALGCYIKVAFLCILFLAF